MHNQINLDLDKPEQDYFKSIDDYYEHYKKVDLSPLEQLKERRMINTLVMYAVIGLGIWYLYTKI